MSRFVIAFGGNALGNNPKEQQELIDSAVVNLIDLIKSGNEIVVSHGNGPQVGIINLAFDEQPAYVIYVGCCFIIAEGKNYYEYSCTINTIS